MMHIEATTSSPFRSSRVSYTGTRLVLSYARSCTRQRYTTKPHLVGGVLNLNPGADDRIRIGDLLFTKQLLYH